MDGPHPISRCEQVTNEVLDQVFDELERQRVELEGIVLKPNMVVSGSECPAQAGVEEVAEATLRTLKAHVPADVPGIAFLSGGQSAEDATAHLSAMNARGRHPWEVSFSYGRALQAPALSAWGGRAGSVGGCAACFRYARAPQRTGPERRVSAGTGGGLGTRARSEGLGARASCPRRGRGRPRSQGGRGSPLSQVCS